jgi:TMEM175 potassium channel family protein
VLELHAPEGDDLATLHALAPTFLSYVLSFIFIGIYWNNHHHLWHAAKRVNGSILWANLHLLFWLSLIPFVMSWMSENHFAAVPTSAYGIVQLLSAIAYTILERAIIAHQGPRSTLAAAVGKDVKANVSIGLYLAGIPLAFADPRISFLLYATVSLIWLVPDRRIERRL